MLGCNWVSKPWEESAVCAGSKLGRGASFGEYGHTGKRPTTSWRVWRYALPVVLPSQEHGKANTESISKSSKGGCFLPKIACTCPSISPAPPSISLPVYTWSLHLLHTNFLLLTQCWTQIRNSSPPLLLCPPLKAKLPGIVTTGSV